MKNTFYNAFDLERFPDTPVAESDYRNAFQIERDRIIFSYPFRRLQSKTQVFQSGEYDFYRTRLTHSIEVAKIGRSICEYLRGNSDQLNDRFYIDADLTEAVGLAHDLGHPPFGHVGERKLNELMYLHGGFEGNAQTLRILTELIYERPGSTKGIAPTRALLDGVMKYKALHRECIQTDDNGSRHYPESAHVVLPEIVSKEPLGPAVRHGDSEWADIVRWSLNAMIIGEELGITSSNVEEMKGSNNPEVLRLLGVESGYGAMLGLSDDWAANILSQVGNYSESFEKHIGPNTPINIQRGLNALYKDGGILYAPPFR
jgi:dGTPase